MEQTIAIIVNIQSNEKMFWIVDDSGVKYTFFKTKRSDGQETEAQKTFKKLEIKVGDKVRFNYAINGEYKNIMSFISKEK